MTDIDSFREELQSLISKFEKDRNYYLSKGYPEAQVRLDFINPFFNALGWDIENKAQKPPHDRDVIVELSPETTKRPDYNFRISGVTKFFIEAKAPSVVLDDVNHILQAKSYAWSTKEVYFVILTDFEEFRLYDASLKPNPKFPNEGLIFELTCANYLENIEKLWELSRERVQQGSLEALLPRDTKSKRLRIPPDKSFLEDLTLWRTELAKDVYKRNPQFDVRLLNDVVQKLLDRIIFIRIAEDRKIRPDRDLWEIVAQWKEEGKRKSIMTHLIELFREVNDDLNGDIFKRHACETVVVDSNILSDIIESLYFPKSRYRFDAIGVELLGSIYERYLGSTIRVTPQRVKIEEKPEVRKAGGVYYTPKYIVDYIVKNTVGNIIEGKTPRQIEKIKILDPACGSGSFLLGAYQYLIDYHLKYYREHPKEAQTLHLFPYWKMSPEEFTLPIHEKAKILRNNIFGVDIDPQAVEITMMSLYLKALEGERGLLPKKQHLLPPLSNNIKCGNSLISYDIFDNLFSSVIPASRARRESFPKKDSRQAGMTEKEKWNDETKSRINPFDWNSKSAGFGEITENGGFDVVIGNPPYGAFFDEAEKAYIRSKFKSYKYRYDSYIYFIETALNIVEKGGFVSYITPELWLKLANCSPLRKLISEIAGFRTLKILGEKVFESAVVNTIIFVLQRSAKADNLRIEMAEDVWNLPTHIWQSSETYAIDYRLRPESINLASKLNKQRSLPLSNFGEAIQGITPYDRYRGQSKALIKRRGYHYAIKHDETCGKWLSGHDVSRYELNWSGEWLSYGPWLAAPRDPRFFEGRRLLFREVPGPGKRIQATIAEGTYYHGHSITPFKPHPTMKVDLRYLLTLVNSTLISWYGGLLLPNFGKDIFPKLNPQDIKELPIHDINFNNPSEKAIHDNLVSLVDRMLDLHKKKNALPPSAEREKIEREIAVTDEKIDEIVYGLYGITEEERRILEKS